MKQLIQLTTLYLFISILLMSCSANIESPKLYVDAVENPLVSLNGEWKFSMEPPAEFWKNDVKPANWSSVQVPGELAMQGFAIKHDQSYVYKREIAIPEDYKNKVIKLRFDGVYNYTKVWVNGNFVTEHYGGFTSWESDITEYVQPGERALLTVEIKDLKNGVSYGSGYAKHQIGGILRDVWLKALPENYLEHLYAETDLDKNYKDANLNIDYELSIPQKSKIILRLLDPENKNVQLSNNEINITGENYKGGVRIPVKNPLKWDAEHPYLYTLVTELYHNDTLTYTNSQKIGFREIEVSGNKLLVNGKPVKLRGVNRHDMHPLLGRTSTPEYDKKDVLLAKEANVNYIRTSHYPPSASFLKFCDKYGIYVEAETAVNFVNTHRTPGYDSIKQSGPEFKDPMLSQLKEMVDNHRNHPSVIIWSTANESIYDSNIQLSYDWLKANDPSRPVKFSYPGTVPDSSRAYDILSMHYPTYNGNKKQHGIETKDFNYVKMPAIFDEWAHVSCYNNQTLMEDPNVRNFWGRSLDKTWNILFESDGGLGGAIWGMIDETFMLPDTLSGFGKWWGIVHPNMIPENMNRPVVGYGKWGIIDIWRRKKPEFWNVKKAYSPAKILIKNITDYTAGNPVEIPVYNRFDHTNFNELNIAWSYQNKSGIIDNLDIASHQKGQLKVPAHNWQEGEVLNIKFIQHDTLLVDTYNLRLGTPKNHITKEQPGNEVDITEQRNSFIVHADEVAITFDKKNGLISQAIYKGENLIKSGPYLNLRTKGPKNSAKNRADRIINRAQNWKLENLQKSIDNGVAQVTVKGSYNSVNVDFNIRIDGKRTIFTNYTVHNPPAEQIQEIGVRFVVPDRYDKIEWNRNAYWTAYPKTHIGRPKGEAAIRNQENLQKYRVKPDHVWAYDVKDFYYFGQDHPVYQYKITNIAKAQKTHIRYYKLKASKDNSNLTVLGASDIACHIFPVNEENLTLYISNLWDYANLNWGNYERNINLEKSYSNQVIVKLGD